MPQFPHLRPTCPRQLFKPPAFQLYRPSIGLKMRLPYAPTEPPNDEAAPIYQRIAERRKPRPLIPLDLALLHSPPVADGWNSFIGAIRSKMTLEPRILELAVSRVAVLNGAVHEWDVHAGLALKAGVLKEGMKTAFTHPALDAGTGAGLSDSEWAVLRYTDQMTRQVKVDEDVFESVKDVLGDEKMVVELTTAIAAYNCVSRFLVALDVGECNERPMKSVDELAKA